MPVQGIERPTFIQNSRIGRRIFQITGDYLEISGTMLGRKKEEKFLLRSLNPNFQYESRRMHRMIMTFVILAVICARIWLYIVQHDRLPQGLAIYPGMFSVIFLTWAIIFCPRFEFYWFNNHWGKTAFYIIRERKQQAEFDAFLAELVAQIESPGRILGPELSQESSGFGFTAASAGTAKSNWRWRVALTSSVVAVSLPWIPGVAALLREAMYMLVFLSSMSGLGFGIMAFMAKEPSRYYALPAMLLAMIPPFFY